MNTPIGAPARTAARSARAALARWARAGLAGTALAGLGATALPAGPALAASAQPARLAASAAARPAVAGRAGHPADVPGLGRQVSPGVRAACGSAGPGTARCFALIRTDIKSHARMSAGGTPSGYSPADLQSAYNLPSATAGQGQTVAIVDAYDDPNAAADLATYRAQYGLPPCTTANGCFRKVAQDGSTNYPLPDTGWAAEISLDLDMVSAACPRCHILLVEASSAAPADLGAAVNEAVALGAKYVSNSYGTYEPATDITAADQARFDALYYNHPGVAVTAASGDSGYGVSYPAASPDVTAVGGTTLTRDSATSRGWSETAWSGTGSGCSASEPKPSWQKDTGCANRTVADVSAVADPATGVAVYDSYGLDRAPFGLAPGWNVIGGTSVASPVIASVYALAGTPSPAATPASYPYADPSALNDVTSGSDSRSGCSPAYLCTAGPGYDGPTGMGTPDGVAAFRYGVHGPHGDLAGSVTDAATGKPVADAQVSAGGFTAITDAVGHYDLAVAPGSVSVTASGYGYVAKTASGVTVTKGQTRTENFSLASVPMETVSGTVSDGSGHGWPLYAKVSVPGTPAVAYTSPATGHYSLHLPADGSYTVQADPVYPGYQQTSQQVSVGTAGVTLDLAATVDAAACAAPGYHSVTSLSETFDASTVPAGWTVVTNGTDPASTWRFDQPGGYQNYTGGSGNYAAAWLDGTRVTPADEELITPVMNLSANHAPRLTFDLAENYSSQKLSVEVSTDGGSTWSTAWTDHGNSIFGQSVAVPLPMAAGARSVQLRFHEMVTPLPGVSTQAVQLDNVNVSSCDSAGGGLVTGRLLDANTGQGVDGATVSGGQPGVATTSLPVPGDPHHRHGFYALFTAATGRQPLTAVAPGYAAATGTATVTAGQVTSANLTMKAGRVSVTSGPVSATQTLGGTATAAVTVRNTGSAPATVNLGPRPGGFTLAGPSQPARGAKAGGGTAAPGFPLIRIHGRFSPQATVPVLAPARAGRVPAAAPAPAAGTQWTRLADVPAAVTGNAGAVDPATGRVYSAGGAYSATRVVADVSVLDPATGQWSALPPMRNVRFAPQAAFIGGKLYVAGGAGQGPQGPQGSVSQLEIYDPASGTWSAGAPVPHAYSDAATVVLNGKMYVIGGCDPSGSCGETSVQVYRPATDHWSAAADYPIPVSHQGCGAIGGKIYCAGGVGQLLASGTRAGYVYDPRANTWSPIADLPGELWGGGYGAADGKLLLTGGITAQGTILTNQGYVYDPAANSWSSLPNAPQPSYEGASACGFYTFGGWTAFSQGTANPAGATFQLPGYGGCGGPGWLSASPATVTVPPGQTATVKVTLNAAIPAVTQPGTYTASLLAENSTPYGAPVVPVTFTVTPPKTWGKLAGTVTGKTCAGVTGPLPGATVQVSAGHATWTLATDTAGRYALWLHAASRASLIASLPGWQPQAAQVQVRAGATTTRGFTLSQSCG